MFPIPFLLACPNYAWSCVVSTRPGSTTPQPSPLLRYSGDPTLVVEADVLGITADERSSGFGINNLIIELYLATPHTGYPTANGHPLIVTGRLVITQRQLGNSQLQTILLKMSKRASV